MRMLIVLLAVLSFCLSFKSMDYSFRVSSRLIEENHLRTYSILVMDVNRAQIDNPVITYEFRDFKKKSLGRIVRKITKDEWSECSNCVLKLNELPSQYELNTCSLNVVVKSITGQLISTHDLEWGKCHEYPVTQPILRSDLRFTEMDSVPWNTAVSISNDGRSKSKTSSLVGILLDKNFAPIWNDEIYFGEIEVNGVGQVLFNKSFKNWHWERGCYLSLTINPDSSIDESNMANNYQLFEVGKCQDEPTENSGARYDFSVQGNWDSNLLNLTVKNDGNLTLTTFSDLTYSVRFSDFTGNILSYKEWSTKINLYGFSDSANLSGIYSPPSACIAEVIINNQRYLSETNYDNNYLKINICH